MAEDKRSAPGDKPRRRPAPTIDLSATEVQVDPPPQAAKFDPKPEPPPAAAEVPASRGPLATYAVGGLIVGVVFGAGALWLAGSRSVSQPATDPLVARIAALESQLREQGQRPVPAPAEAPKPVQPDTSLSDRIGAIEKALAALNTRAQELQVSLQQPAVPQASLDALGKRLDSIEQAAKTTQEKVTQNAGADAAARQALAMIALRDAVSRGAPYAAELAAVKSLGADAQAVAALDAFAGTGVPGDATLSRELAAVIPSLMKAGNADPSQAAGFIEKLQANASKLVRIRPVGEPEGADPSAVIARIEVKAAHNDVAGAEREIATLPSLARSAAEPWLKKLAARNAALAAARKLAADSAAALGANK